MQVRNNSYFLSDKRRVPSLFRDVSQFRFMILSLPLDVCAASCGYCCDVDPVLCLRLRLCVCAGASVAFLLSCVSLMPAPPRASATLSCGTRCFLVSILLPGVCAASCMGLKSSSRIAFRALNHTANQDGAGAPSRRHLRPACEDQVRDPQNCLGVYPSAAFFLGGGQEGKRGCR